MPTPDPQPQPSVAVVAPDQAQHAVSIRDGASIVWVPGVKHDHRGNRRLTATERWRRVRLDTRLPTDSKGAEEWGKEWLIRDLSQIATPQQLVDMAIAAEFKDKPIALKHLRWFLTDGKGAVFDENDNLTRLLTTDSSIRTFLANQVRAQSQRSGWPVIGRIAVDRDDYRDPDLQFAFGSIDAMCYFADKGAGTFRAWFLDCYEWHPPYTDSTYGPLYPAADGTIHRDDYHRYTDAVHAACVELKEGTARDFWMQGDATVQLSAIMGS